MSTGVTIGPSIAGIADTVGDGNTGRVGLGVEITVFTHCLASLILIRALRTGSTGQSITNVPRIAVAVGAGGAGRGTGGGLGVTVETSGIVAGVVLANVTCQT